MSIKWRAPADNIGWFHQPQETSIIRIARRQTLLHGLPNKYLLMSQQPLQLRKESITEFENWRFLEACNEYNDGSEGGSKRV